MLHEFLQNCASSGGAASELKFDGTFGNDSSSGSRPVVLDHGHFDPNGPHTLRGVPKTPSSHADKDQMKIILNAINDGSLPFSTRKPNFGEEEKLFLIEQYQLYRHILDVKGVDRQNNINKRAIWQSIADGLNQLNPKTTRTVYDVRKKWKNLISDTKKTLADIRDLAREGLQAPPLDVITRRILEVYLPNNGEAAGGAEVGEVVFDAAVALGQLNATAMDDVETSYAKDPTEENDEACKSYESYTSAFYNNNQSNGSPAVESPASSSCERDDAGAPSNAKRIKIEVDDGASIVSANQNRITSTRQQPSNVNQMFAAQQLLPPVSGGVPVSIPMLYHSTPFGDPAVAADHRFPMAPPPGEVGGAPAAVSNEIAALQLECLRMQREKLRAETEKIELEKQKLSLEIEKLVAEKRKLDLELQNVTGNGSN